MVEREEREIWTVSTLNRYVREYLEQNVTLHSLWVRGEISNFKHHSRGHMYFTLKDEASRMNAVMFARHNRRLKFVPKDGDNVLVRCSLSMYEIGGQIQLYVKEMQPDGIGTLFLAFEQLKQKLEAEGLFQQERKRPLPPHPKTVGVVTSPTGAAVRDIVTTIARRSPHTNVLLFPAIVQGDDAVQSVVDAIELANRHFQEEVDVLIVGRGGGSLEELWAFNEEAVARAIVLSDIPVIAAVGHETDVTIADFVADVRAATPTAAAELAVPSRSELAARVHDLHNRVGRATTRLLERYREQLNRCRKSPVMRRPALQLREYIQRLDYLHADLTRAATNQVKRNADRLAYCQDRIRLHRLSEKVALVQKELRRAEQHLVRGLERMIREKQSTLEHKLRQLDALSPLKVMQRGYSLVYREDDGRFVKTIGEVDLGDIVHVHVSDGKLSCQVWGLEEKTHGGK